MRIEKLQSTHFDVSPSHAARPSEDFASALSAASRAGGRAASHAHDTARIATPSEGALLGTKRSPTAGALPLSGTSQSVHGRSMDLPHTSKAGVHRIPSSDGTGVGIWRAEQATVHTGERIGQAAQRTSDADTSVADERLREVCRQFEAFFTAQLLQIMRESGDVEGFIETSRGEKVFRAQHDTELAQHLAHRGAFGIGDLLYRQLSEQIGSADAQLQTEGE
jgi:flagellar protein FlgJ